MYNFEITSAFYTVLMYNNSTKSYLNLQISNFVKKWSTKNVYCEGNPQNCLVFLCFSEISIIR